MLKAKCRKPNALCLRDDRSTKNHQLEIQHQTLNRTSNFKHQTSNIKPLPLELVDQPINSFDANVVQQKD
jgi:hypothetical protein